MFISARPNSAKRKQCRSRKLGRIFFFVFLLDYYCVKAGLPAEA